MILSKNMKTLKFDETVATKIIQLIQHGMITGSDVSEEFMNMEMVVKGDKLTLDPLYAKLSEERIAQQTAELLAQTHVQEPVFNPFKPFTMDQ